MHLTYVAMSAAVTLSVAGGSYLALNPDQLRRPTQMIADHATCRVVDQAIVAYAGATGEAPRTMADLQDYIEGDVHAYRIVAGRAAGPGC
jgi:hypothetical protein